MTSSALYVGRVDHRRLRGLTHALRYQVFMLLLDLDEVDGLLRHLKMLRRGRFGLLSFDPRDHGDGSDAPLKVQVEARLAAAGITGGGPVRLLCMPRVLGYGFNPLSIYFCDGADGRLAAIVYEVTSTFGERYSYVIPCDAGEGEVVSQTADKRLHVSPFMDMGLTYRFTVRPPTDSLSVAIRVDDAEGPLLGTGFVGWRRPLSDATLLSAWAGHPLLTWKVIAGIHWEALKLWLKGAVYHPRPAPLAQTVTLGSNVRTRRFVFRRRPAPLEGRQDA
ncbi:MAG: hypothetical protein B7Y99_02310 [Caulobacterales bacterium 32-69-10]|nr:MAG: hypothetical protein B7Y99_02310 [Caulobacterales bacterium 32-69-10]